MNGRQLFSKAITITNDGLLPVFRVHCGMAVKKIVPYNDVPLIGTDDFTARLENAGCYAGTLSPGDGLSFSPEELVLLPITQAREADFAIYISYIPVFPPVRMDQCVHFVLHESIVDGQRYWFRSPGQCARFPWLHSVLAHH